MKKKKKKKKKFSPIFVISLNIHRTIRSQLSFYLKKLPKIKISKELQQQKPSRWNIQHLPELDS